MKKIIGLLFFFVIFQKLYSQEFDKTYYFLGITDEYMERNVELDNPKKNNLILKLYKNQKKEISRIEEVSGLKFTQHQVEENCSNCHFFYDLKSDEYALKINNYHDFKKDKFKQNDGYYNFKGKLNAEKILKNADENQLISYLAGTFLIHGKKKIEEDGNYEVYEISVANAQPQFEILKSILKKLKIYLIKEEIWYKTPYTFHLKFNVDEKIKKILDKELSFQTSLEELYQN